MGIIRISYQEMYEKFRIILVGAGFSEPKAGSCARIFADNSLEGVYSHGINRFPRFIEYIHRGFIDPGAEPLAISSAGAIEQWDGKLGPGPLNAVFFTNRAMQLAGEYGVGCVAAAHTNHWMRGGTYGWLAAREGYAFMGWTNTEANMPAWGATDRRLGNNPLVFAIPYAGEAIVLDFALTQFSYGKMEDTHLKGQTLPYPGGFDTHGRLTSLPGEILQSGRALPVGLWKGASLSLLLDMMAAVLSSGLSTSQVSRKEAEYGVSQVFIAFSLKKLENFPAIERTISEIVADFKQSVPENKDGQVRYPGERAVATRKHNFEHGIPVNEVVWEKINNLLP